MRTRFTVCLAALLVASCASIASYGADLLYYTSSPHSYIGGGETLLLEGLSADASFKHGFPTSVVIRRLDSSGAFWEVALVGPNNSQPTVGSYSFTEGWPFQPSGQAGFIFGAENREDANVRGAFQVLEIERVGDDLTKLAVDFTQFEKFNLPEFTMGSIRFHSDIPITFVPEPSTFALAALGGVGLLAVRRRFARL